ncbi:hypothetical protein B0T22DRAFT_25930 [Podospora appendiculata]|uniref:Uncharacterized protein n=1 Tax=Podospora appendiculata TaxID=314037 RepID=A0AAE0XG12_9PEZI|nr:hypothetical protein B0T22DRAFT_25930 [Podospora appendiculata]
MMRTTRAPQDTPAAERPAGDIRMTTALLDIRRNQHTAAETQRMMTLPPLLPVATEPAARGRAEIKTIQTPRDTPAAERPAVDIRMTPIPAATRALAANPVATTAPLDIRRNQHTAAVETPRTMTPLPLLLVAMETAARDSANLEIRTMTPLDIRRSQHTAAVETPRTMTPLPLLLVAMEIAARDSANLAAVEIRMRIPLPTHSAQLRRTHPTVPTMMERLLRAPVATEEAAMEAAASSSRVDKMMQAISPSPGIMSISF